MLEEWSYDSPPTPYVPLTKDDRDSVFQLMFYEYFQASMNVDHLVPEALAPVPADSTGSPSSISIDQDAPFRSITQITLVTQSQLLLKVLMLTIMIVKLHT
jgi:hypothetical protein